MPATPIRWTNRTSSSKSINCLQHQPTWNSTAVVIMYDDSDGWYDHQMGPIVNHVDWAVGRSDRAGSLRHGATVRCLASTPRTLTRWDVADTARACPCWWSLPGRGRTSWTTP